MSKKNKKSLRCVHQYCGVAALVEEIGEKAAVATCVQRGDEVDVYYNSISMYNVPENSQINWKNRQYKAKKKTYDLNTFNRNKGPKFATILRWF